ncbi:bromodomain-containing protein 8-like isoform X2 [Pseudoliparis swirei]|uniref:bromodomain-containing protein 8-like isoform X2 n=1 Tax=Pseudoliparis swirei TaxID=2059687 RepID=UPI0024BDC6F8|nr:bromodomain-containing protein 8-like isoform X2 [Pseudoliparis swirei]
MANGVGKHKLLVLGPTEPWSAREKLCLATSVMKSGDQNWVSVSRAIKPFAEPGRPPDWFSQKHCASKYSALLQTIEAPKRKRGDRGEEVETLEDVIVRRLTADRIDALKKLIKETQEKHRKLKRETELIQAGRLDSKLEELWEDILQKKKLEEKEAELKRKITNAAYQARQVAKNSSKRDPGITVHSPPGCGSPSQESSPGDPPQCLTLDLALTKSASGSARLITIAESSGPGNDDVIPGSLLDDPAQKKLLVQKATPPPSPLLSELLKKGSILATNARLIGEGDVTSAHMTGAHDLQPALPSQPLAQATEVDAMEPPLAPGCQPITTEDKVAELSEEGVTGSYMGEELDLKTTDVTAEALDAAAVEAALSLCEENGHALPGAWEPAGVRRPPSHRSGPEGKTAASGVQGATSASLSSPRDSRGSGLAAGPRALPHASSSSSRSSKRSERCRPGAPRETGASARRKSHISLDVALRRESDRWAQRRPGKAHRDSVLGDSSLTERHPKGMRAAGEKASGTKVHRELSGPEARGDEEADGAEGLLSEPDGEPEPAASESEDGSGLHAAPSSLQLHTAADSIPSSPASSQFSVCSEDHEALQAHKIWKKAIMLVWRAAANHRYANVFLQPVTHEIAPGYHSIVQRPMDLAAIKKSIETGVIRTTAEFQRDIMLMFQNAVMYNSLDHDVYHMALEMQRDVLEQIQQFLATQLIMETAESGIGAKSLRGRESTRKQDPADKDAVSMSSPAFLLSLFDGGTRGRRCAIEADLKMKK